MYASEEGAATSTEAAVAGEEAAETEPVQASAPKRKVPAGPMMQPEEDRRRAKEEKELAEKPKGNPWASNVFKRGVVLQVCVCLECMRVACRDACFCRIRYCCIRAVWE